MNNVNHHNFRCYSMFLDLFMLDNEKLEDACGPGYPSLRLACPFVDSLLRITHSRDHYYPYPELKKNPFTYLPRNMRLIFCKFSYAKHKIMKVSTIFFISAIIIFLSFSSSSSFVEIFDKPEVIVIDATLNTSECNNKAYVPLEIPKTCTGLIYSVNVVDRAEAKSPSRTLLNEVSSLSEKYEPSKIADYLVPSEANRAFNFYIIPSKKHIESFNNCGYFEHYEKYVGTKSKASYFDLKDRGQETIYIGIENPNNLKSLRVVIEAVAVVE